MKSFLSILVVLFCVTLAVVIGNRMSTEAMAVVVGVVCGVVASIPVSILLILVTGRLQSGGAPAREERAPGYGSAAYPPVVIVTPGSDGRLAAMPYMPGNFPLPSLRREFTIVGEEAE